MTADEARSIYEELADAKNKLLRALRAAEPCKGTKSLVRRIESVTGRVEALQRSMKFRGPAGWSK